MGIIVIVLLAIVYIFIAGVVGGVALNSRDSDIVDKMFFGLLWPILLAGLIIAGLFFGPVKLGEKIRERLNK